MVEREGVRGRRGAAAAMGLAHGAEEIALEGDDREGGAIHLEGRAESVRRYGFVASPRGEVGDLLREPEDVPRESLLEERVPEAELEIVVVEGRAQRRRREEDLGPGEVARRRSRAARRGQLHSS